MKEFMWFPEAVVRGALGYYWRSEGAECESLYRLFFGDDVSKDERGNLIATPPHGGRLVITPIDDYENCVNLQLTLFGRNEKLIPKFVRSIQVLGREGIGENRVHIEVVGESEIQCGLLQDFLNPEPKSLSKSCKLTIESPMTLKMYGGKTCCVWDSVSFATNLVQRASLLNRFYGNGDSLYWNMENLADDFRNIVSWTDTVQISRGRMSSRQHQRVDYSGFCGVVFLHNITRENYTLLRIGEQLAVGKNTVFGSGGFVLTSV